MESIQKSDDALPETTTSVEKDSVTLWQVEKGLTIKLINEKVVRFRYLFANDPQPDISYALIQTENLSMSFSSITESKEALMLFTPILSIKVSKKDLTVSISNAEGITVLEDTRPIQKVYDHISDTHTLKLERNISDGEQYYGLGDKSGPANLRGQVYTLWNTDQYGYYGHTDPLYKSIPFYMGLHHGMAYGLFYDNTYLSRFDFGHNNPKETAYSVQGGELNYYFIYGPEMLHVCQHYTLLTGTPELPPLWALGYHQCKWSYHPQSMVEEVTLKMRDLEVPCDVIYLDIDYMDGYRCFTWDKNRFPEFQNMIRELLKQGFKVVCILDPGIKIDDTYWVYQQALEKKYFCHRSDGGLITGKVWPGLCHFPDFTSAEVRQWWADLHEELIVDCGVKGIWTDMNEPAILEVPNKTFPENARHDNDGYPSSHRKAHNIYGMMMSKSSYDGVKKFIYPERPFLITRATYSGGQRYASVWTGDNIASWDHLNIANIQTQRLSISGFSFCGSDVGGFIETPTPELFTRWIQLSFLHPFFRTHSSGDHGDQEPWSFGEATLAIVKKFIQLRYRLLSYLYSSFYQYHRWGLPMLRPIYMVDQHDVHTHYRSGEVCLGHHLLFSLVYEANKDTKAVYLPKGDWINYWDNKPYQGGHEYLIDVPIDQSILFVRGGTILPLNPDMQYVGEYTHSPSNFLLYYKHGDEISHLYDDEGNGYAYQNGGFTYRKFMYSCVGNHIQIRQEVEGDLVLPYHQFHFIPKAFPGNISVVFCDGLTIEVLEDQSFWVDNRFTILEIVINKNT